MRRDPANSKNAKHAKKLLEQSVEQYLVIKIQQLGGICEKVVSLSGRGFFDRVCVLPPHGRVIFVECKRPRGGRLSAHQAERLELYAMLGAETATVKNRDQVDALLADP